MKSLTWLMAATQVQKNGNIYKYVQIFILQGCFGGFVHHDHISWSKLRKSFLFFKDMRERDHWLAVDDELAVFPFGRPLTWKTCLSACPNVCFSCITCRLSFSKLLHTGTFVFTLFALLAANITISTLNDNSGDVIHACWLINTACLCCCVLVALYAKAAWVLACFVSMAYLFALSQFVPGFFISSTLYYSTTLRSAILEDIANLSIQQFAFKPNTLVPGNENITIFYEPQIFFRWHYRVWAVPLFEPELFLESQSYVNNDSIAIAALGLYVDGPYLQKNFLSSYTDLFGESGRLVQSSRVHWPTRINVSHVDIDQVDTSGGSIMSARRPNIRLDNAPKEPSFYNIYQYTVSRSLSRFNFTVSGKPIEMSRWLVLDMPYRRAHHFHAKLIEGMLGTIFIFLYLAISSCFRAWRLEKFGHVISFHHIQTAVAELDTVGGFEVQSDEHPDTAIDDDKLDPELNKFVGVGTDFTADDSDHELTPSERRMLETLDQSEG
jgi:hypothetical protein